MKVAILGGGGGVGSSAAFNLLLQPEPHDLVLVDPREEMVTSHLMDLEQVLEIGASGSVRGGDARDVLDADVVVVTAATSLTINTSRLEYLTTNGEIVAGLVERLAEHDGWSGFLVVVTNPVDPLCTWIQRQTGLDRRRVLGYSLNDSLRLRTGIAKALGVDIGSVEAWVIGEHGDSCVPLFDRVLVAGEPVALTREERDEVERFLRTWYVRHVALDSGRSSTWTSGVGVARMVNALAAGAAELWPASVVLAGEYGVDGVALSVPVSLGRDGALVQEWTLSRGEQDALERSAVIVREATDQLSVAVTALDAGREGAELD